MLTFEITTNKLSAGRYLLFSITNIKPFVFYISIGFFCLMFSVTAFEGTTEKRRAGQPVK